MILNNNLWIDSSFYSFIVSSPVHRGSDTTNTFLASPSVNPISPAISSMSSNSAKPLNTQLTSTSLTVAPPRVSHGSITFADDVGKSLTETKGNTKNIADKRTTPEVIHTCQHHQCPEEGQDKQVNANKCTNNSTQSQRISSSDVATSPISPHYFMNSKFDPESFDTCSCSRPKKPNKPAIKPYKDTLNSDDNHSNESNATFRTTQSNEMELKEVSKYSRHVDTSQASDIKRKNGVIDTQMNPSLLNESEAQSKHHDIRRNYNDSQTNFAPFSHVSEKARLIESEVTATSDFDSSEGNCDECDPHEHQEANQSSNTFQNHHLKHVPNHDSPQLPNSSANVVHSDGGHPLVDCYGGGSCSEECYSYSGSASGCSCMGSCDQQSQLNTEDGDSIITGATVGSSLAANNDGFVTGFSSNINNPRECMASSLIDASMLASTNASVNRRMNGTSFQQNHSYQLDHDQIDQNLDLSIILRPQKGHHHHHTLPHPRSQFNNSHNTKAAKSMETIPLEMCQDIPDVLI